MFFETLSQLEHIARSAQTVIVCLSDEMLVDGKKFKLADFAKSLKAMVIEPEEGKIKIEQARSVLDVCTTKQSADRFFVFAHAETMTVGASNSLLKLLEEPLENYHFLLFTTTPSAILPTIRSRAAIYSPKLENRLNQLAPVKDDIGALAKELLAAKPAEVISIAEKLAKKKEDVRRIYALSVLEATIDLAEKSYFKTKNPAFAKKLDGLIAAHAGISQNGNLKLQFIANLV